MKRLFNRYPTGGGLLAINPAMLAHLEIYLSGQIGVTPNTNLSSLTKWADQSGNGRDFVQIPSGGIAPVVLTTGLGLAPGVTCCSFSAGGSPREISNNVLPAFTQARGTTQYVLVNANVAGGNAMFVNDWQIAGGGPDLVYQPGGFDGTADWFSFGSVIAGNVGIKIGSIGIDTGVVTPSQRWDLWTMLVHPGPGALDWYRNGTFVGTAGTAVSYVLSTEMDLGGPSNGNAQFWETAAYLLYTDTHSAGTIKAVYEWFKAIYGI